MNVLLFLFPLFLVRLLHFVLSGKSKKMKEEEEIELSADDDIACIDCGSVNFHYDPRVWESSCRNCGLVAPYEVDTVFTYVKPKTYFKHNYFTNTILTNAMTKGFRISRPEMEEIERRYKMCVKKFYETKETHERKYMLNANFCLGKIAHTLGKDVTPFIKIPKKDTLLKLEKDWLVVNPF